jgi:hypothetical protein
MTDDLLVDVGIPRLIEHPKKGLADPEKGILVWA